MKRSVDELVKKTLNCRLQEGYVAHCVCTKCLNSYQMRPSGYKRLLSQVETNGAKLTAPNDFNLEQIGKYYLLFGPCFICKNGEPISVEVKLKPNQCP